MESSLAIAYQELVAEVAFNLGFGRAVPTDSDQKADVDSCVKSGLRQFYFPPPIAGQESAYNWSFLQPILTATFTQGSQTVKLPDDFGGFSGQLTVLSGASGTVPWPIDLLQEGTLRQKYAETPEISGRPLFAALRPLKGTTVLRGQIFELLMFPAADQDYRLQFAYFVNPDYLSGAFPYAYGGAQHAETILESCLAIAEQRLDDSASVHTMKFQERLMASISLDRNSKAQKLGQNLDRSDDLYRRFHRGEYHGFGQVTYNGATL